MDSTLNSNHQSAAVQSFSPLAYIFGYFISSCPAAPLLVLLLLFHLIYKLFFMHISENFITKIKKEIWAKMSQTGFQPVGILLLLAVDWIRFAKAFTHGGRGGCYFLALSPSLSLCCTLKRNRNRLSSIPVSEGILYHAESIDDSMDVAALLL